MNLSYVFVQLNFFVLKFFWLVRMGGFKDNIGFVLCGFEVDIMIIL